MILNTYAVLCVSLGLLRLLLGLVVIALGALAWRAGRRTTTDDLRLAMEERSYLVFLLAIVLLLLNVVSWPVLYLLLQSYVPEWPGVMCIYGVTQVGKGSLGPSRLLPGLLDFLQMGKPALAFVSGAWFVLYALNRNTRTAPLLPRLFVVLIPLGMLAAADASAEIAYVAIPKQEEFPSSGCCTGVLDEAESRFRPHGFLRESAGVGLSLTYYVAIAGHILLLVGCMRRRGALPSSLELGGLLLAGVAVLGIGAMFLVDVAAPRLLRLPHHHCPYDLISEAPESLIAVALFLGGCFFLGWAAVARWCGDRPETRPFLAGAIRRLLRLSLFSHVFSLALVSMEMALA